MNWSERHLIERRSSGISDLDLACYFVFFGIVTCNRKNKKTQRTKLYRYLKRERERKDNKINILVFVIKLKKNELKMNLK